jgi:hypothetical protein
MAFLTRTKCNYAEKVITRVFDELLNWQKKTQKIVIITSVPGCHNMYNT